MRFLCLILLVFSMNVMAEDTQKCDDLTLQILEKHLGKKFSEGETDYRIVSQACKSAPDDKNITLVALAILKSKPEPDYSVYDKIVAKVDNTKRVVRSLEQEEVESDAITEFGEYSLRIDTARYKLNSNTRAFGVVYNSSALGPSCASGAWNNELTLYVEKGKKLVPLVTIPMRVSEAKVGCLGTASMVEPVIVSVDLTISVLKKHTNGYADLLLNASESDLDTGNGGIPKKFKASKRLYFDGKKYVADTKQCKPWWVFLIEDNRIECRDD